MLHPKKRENESEKPWIAGQADERGCGASSAGKTVYTVRQPGIGNVTIDKAVPIDVRKRHGKIQAKRQPSEGPRQKETFVTLQQIKKFPHARRANMIGI